MSFITSARSIEARDTPKTREKKAIVRRDQINSRLQHLVSGFNKNKGPINLSERLEQCNDPETWSDLIIQSMIYNLIPGSNDGRFGTPDADLLKAVTQSKPRGGVYVKILGIKIAILLSLGLGLSEDKINRIRLLQGGLEKYYQKNKL